MTGWRPDPLSVLAAWRRAARGSRRCRRPELRSRLLPLASCAAAAAVGVAAGVAWCP